MSDPISKAETIVARALSDALGRTAAGSSLEVGYDQSELLPALEAFVDEELTREFPRWRYESLDGIYPIFARKIGELDAEIAGLCCLVGDQTMTPIHVFLRISPEGDRVAGFDMRVGELGEGALGLLRLPYGSREASRLALRLAGRLDEIEWAYRVATGAFQPP